MCEDVINKEDVPNKALEQLDVRDLDPAEREEMIFDHIYELAFGTSFILVNDHSPELLLHQLETEFPGQFFWTHFETGPSVWRVEIGRREKAARRSAGR
jgi:uncharacterized protein (DUF2249 family)